MYFSLKESIVIVSFVILSVVGVTYAAPTQTAPGGQPSSPILGTTPPLIPPGGSAPTITMAVQSKTGEAPQNRTDADVVRRALAIGIDSTPYNFGGSIPSFTPPALGQTIHVNGITKIGSLSLPSGSLTDGLLVDGDVITSGTTTVNKTSSGSTDGDVIITDLIGSGTRNVCIVQNTLTLGFINPWTYNVLVAC